MCPGESVKLYMCLKKAGKVLFQSNCTAQSYKKAKTVGALKIINDMNPNMRWKDLMDQTQEAITQARNKRGAGERPVLQKYNPNSILDEDSQNNDSQDDSSSSDDIFDNKRKLKQKQKKFTKQLAASQPKKLGKITTH